MRAPSRGVGLVVVGRRCIKRGQTIMFVRAGGAAVVNDIEGLLTSSHIEVFLCKKEYYQGHVYQERWIGGMIDIRLGKAFHESSFCLAKGRLIADASAMEVDQDGEFRVRKSFLSLK